MKSQFRQAGFTLVELIVVIVILGILAAVAVPRFMGLETEARVASLKSLAGTLKTAANMAHGVCMAQACANGGAGIQIEGQPIIFASGYPNAATVGRLLQSTDGFTVANNGRFTKYGARTANCYLTYVAASTNAATGVITPPSITFYNAGAITSAATDTAVSTALRVQC
jgi:MSHA pilin protein MshA